jgi:hypothetical protein
VQLRRRWKSEHLLQLWRSRTRTNFRKWCRPCPPGQLTAAGSSEDLSCACFEETQARLTAWHPVCFLCLLDRLALVVFDDTDASQLATGARAKPAVRSAQAAGGVLEVPATSLGLWQMLNCCHLCR